MNINQQIDQELIKNIEELEKAGFDAEKIKGLLKLNKSVDEIKQEFNNKKDKLTLKEAAKALQKVLGTSTGKPLKSDRAYELKLLRLIGDGEIEAEKGSSNRESFLIHKDEVERFKKESSITKEQWRKLAKQQAERIKQLEEQLAGAKTKSVAEEKSEKPNENHEFLTKEWTDELLVQVLKESPEFDGLQEEFKAAVFKETEKIKWRGGKQNLYRNVLEKKVVYPFQTPNEAIKAALETFQNQQ